MGQTILVVEDEPAILELICFAVETAGFATLRAGTVKAARGIVSGEKPDLILLDWMLPDFSGLQWLDILKKDAVTADIPVIMLTARGTESDKVAGLDAGAEDYIVKPFSPRELIARVKAVLRRTKNNAQDKAFTIGSLTIDADRFTVLCSGIPVKIGVIEFRILHLLASHPGHVYSRSQILEHVWEDASHFDERTVDVHILRLRKQLAGCAACDMVETVRGLGYRVSDPRLAV